VLEQQVRNALQFLKNHSVGLELSFYQPEPQSAPVRLDASRTDKHRARTGKDRARTDDR
jgi:hypothetical protein